jgi:hypothetical protein
LLQTSANAPVLGSDERWQLVQRLCESRHFARSAKLREFLLFVVERSLTGRNAEVTEAEIGRHVFGRGDDFIPTEDSIVRGSARQVRIKIKDYFDAEGATEPWRIEIPKGGYLPVFTRTPEPVALPPRDIVLTPAPPPVVTQTRPTPWLVASIAANVLLLGACLWLWTQRTTVPPIHGTNAITEMLKHTPGSISLVASDFSLAAMRSLARQEPGKLSVDDYARWDYSTLEPSATPGSDTARIFDLVRTHRLTRSSDLSLTARIVRLDPGGNRIFPRQSREATARDFRSGSHILLGNPYSTPWTELFESRLGLRWVQGKGYRDQTPASGAPREYFGTNNSYNETGPGFARIALLPNLADENQVLILGGVNMVTMEAAGDFALDPNHWLEIRRMLNGPNGQPIPYFEALLETKAVDNTPQSARLVLARRLRH